MNDLIDPLSLLSVRGLLSKDEYLIPMYQRNYAWGEGEINQLIQDIEDFARTGKPYYIGTLVVFDRDENGKNVYEVIDGQQRLTTLSLLAMALKHEGYDPDQLYEQPNLDFESRENSRKTVEALFRKRSVTLSSDAMNEALLTGYDLMCKRLGLGQNTTPIAKDTDTIPVAEFAKYLFEHVKIVRVEVPKDTDLNHYFEIMNNRGEQLEKHEILKYRLVKALDGIDDKTERDQAKHAFHTIWEACSNMEKYLQMYFPAKSQRAQLFGKNWDEFIPSSFDDFTRIIHAGGSSSEAEPEGSATVIGGDARTLSQLIAPGAERVKRDDDSSSDDSERFNSVINFPNFLLQCLKATADSRVRLDDKELIGSFEKVLLKSGSAIESVKKFGFNLLRTKWLFDRYVIKREFVQGDDRWSLKKIYKPQDSPTLRYRSTFSVRDNEADEGSDEYQVGRRILMLLSAFHVSTPTMVYKHWLSAALTYLSKSESVDPSEYLEYLETVAKAFVFDRHLAETPLGYQIMIHEHEGSCQCDPTELRNEDIEPRLRFGQIESNFVFNYLDYLLWRYRFEERNHDFTFRSSVEHFYPQHPVGEHPKLSPEFSNCFGNLCLISHSKNSKLSNHLPTAKREYYGTSDFDSFKQKLMLNSAEQWGPANESEIKRHQDDMLDLLRRGSTATI